jgi:hypothetical protein
MFPTARSLMQWCSKLSIKKLTELRKQRIQLKRKKTETIEGNISEEYINNAIPKEITMNEVYNHTNLGLDPFERTKLNVRTGFKMFKYCVICGAENTTRNPRQSHHINQIKNRQISGFSLIMQSLNRKTISCCFRCHHKIHTGQYNGMALSDFYDPSLASL